MPWSMKQDMLETILKSRSTILRFICGSVKISNMNIDISDSLETRIMNTDIHSLSATYRENNKAFLEQHLVSKNPFKQFKAWFEEAHSIKEVLEPRAMCLATVSKQGLPSARLVICTGYEKDGFKFFSSYESRKAKELEENPNVAASFYWEILNRSVRIEGHVEKLSGEESTNFFQTRPVRAQVAICASHQSAPIESRDVIIEQEKVFEEVYLVSGKQVPRPEFWGGYVIIPRSVEFWQGQQNRLSDRIRFRRPEPNETADGTLLHKGEDGWVYERLSP